MPYEPGTVVLFEDGTDHVIRRAIVVGSENNGSSHKIEYSKPDGSKTIAVVATTSLSIPKEIHVESSAIHEGQKKWSKGKRSSVFSVHSCIS